MFDFDHRGIPLLEAEPFFPSIATPSAMQVSSPSCCVYRHTAASGPRLYQTTFQLLG